MMVGQFDRSLLGIGLALALALLIGTEREWSADKPIGVRTFGLLGAVGAVAAALADHFGGWIVAAALLATGALIGIALLRSEHGGAGLTTGFAALLTFLIGVLAATNAWLEAVVLAGITTVLLHWKQPIHAWIEHLGKADVEIIARFVLIALVVLPVLPDQTYGPYDAFNPHRIWLLIVLIVGINLAGYVAFRFAGTATGAWLMGALGGVISSTATTLSYVTTSKRSPRLGAVATLVIVVASTVVYARVAIELGIVAPHLLPHAAAPMALFGACLLLFAGGIWLRVRRSEVRLPEQRNPAGFGMALSFAMVYVAVLFAVAIVRDRLGERGIYLVAVVSGLVDVDAVTLSVGELSARHDLGVDIAWRAIFLATLSNLAFKTAAASILGAPSLRRWMGTIGTAAVCTGAVLLWLWP